MAAAQQEPTTIDLTSTQYVILAENQRKKKALAEAKGRCNHLAAENASLLAQLEEQQRDAYTVSEHFRAEVLAKNYEIAQLQADLEAARRDGAAHAERLQEAAAAREAQLRAESEAGAQELYARADALQAELDGVADFKQRQVEFEGVVASLREESKGLREALAAQKTELERYCAGQYAKMRKEYEQRLEELKHAQDEELEERLDASVKRILAHNRHLAEELRLHVQESDVLQSEVRLLEAERRRLLRELGLKAELEEGYARRGAAQGAALKQAQGRVAALEASVAQLLADFQAEKSDVLRQAEAQAAEGRDESEALRRLLRLKARELKALGRLAQEALLQRSEVEIFLISSLHQVRQEQRQQQQQEQEQELEERQQDQCAPTSGREDGSSAGASSSCGLHSAGSSSGGSGAPGAAAGQPGAGSVQSTAAGEAAAWAAAAAGGGGDEGCDTAAAAAAAAAPNVAEVGEFSWEQRERVLKLLFARIMAHAGAGGGGGAA
ncbi:MAG: hypothetical protein J3K34DRAFT_74210 [Monoraphidium minutum]|nr:MAG: hypothetical protein J3K34DRAFT_74210 [Monoraphidium minutum]